MGLSAATTYRLQLAYIMAVSTCQHHVPISQDDARAILLLSDPADTIAAALPNSSYPTTPTFYGY